MAVAAGLPAILSVASTVGGILTTGFQMFSGLRQASFQAKVAERNAQIDEQNAAAARREAAEEQQRADIEARAAIGTQEALQGGSGFALNSPSLNAARRTLRENARLDALTIRRNGEQRARQFEERARMSRLDAETARSSKAGIIAGGVLGLGSTLIGGAQRFQRFRRLAGTGSIGGGSISGG